MKVRSSNPEQSPGQRSAVQSCQVQQIILPPHESEPHYQEPQEDRIALQELLRSFIMQQQSKMKIQDFKPLKLQALPEDQKVQCDKVIHQKYRSAIGKLLWMAQLRDDLRYPVKEQLSRSLINPQDQDIKNLIRLLKDVNQARDFVFVMEPQLPVRNQEGKFPVHIVSYSDSDWAGCQNHEDQQVVH